MFVVDFAKKNMRLKIFINYKEYAQSSLARKLRVGHRVCHTHVDPVIALLLNRRVF